MSRVSQVDQLGTPAIKKGVEADEDGVGLAIAVQMQSKETTDGLANNFARRGLREDETTMEDRSSRRMRKLVTLMARSRPDR
jgi:hypothetical protein